MISLDYHEALCRWCRSSGRRIQEPVDQGQLGQVRPRRRWLDPDQGRRRLLHGRRQADPGDGAARRLKARPSIIGIGSCASWGGIPSSDPNPTQAKSVQEMLPGKTVINIPGCPPNVYNFLSTVLYFVTFGKAPELDDKNRPKFAYGRLIHENCERRPHFDAGRFALEFGDAGHRQGWCLYKIGCKGPETYGQLPGDPVWRRRIRFLAGRHRASVLRLHRTGNWLHQADPFACRRADGHTADGLSAHRRRERPRCDDRRRGVWPARWSARVSVPVLCSRLAWASQPAKRSRRPRALPASRPTRDRG